MKFRSLLLAAAATLVSMSSPSKAAQTPAAAPQSNCMATDYSGTGYLPWFLGIHPSDDLLTVFCRLQQLPGQIRFNILFPTYKMHKSWDTTFDGRDLPATQIVKLVQSVLPMVDAPAKNEDGMEFHKVLQSVVQLQAAKTPSGRPLGFAPEHPAAKELVLWEPILLRIKPVVMAGQEFTLTVTLKPNLGLLALALQGKATDLRFRGFKGRMDTGGSFGRGCSSAMPACEELPDSPIFHAPWIVTNVTLEAHGSNMTDAAVAIMNRLGQYKNNVKTGTQTFNEATGDGRLSVDDTMSRLEMTATGSSGGTTSIRIDWFATDNAMSVEKQLQKVGEDYKIGTGETAKKPPAPDILNKL